MEPPPVAGLAIDAGGVGVGVKHRDPVNKSRRPQNQAVVSSTNQVVCPAEHALPDVVVEVDHDVRRQRHTGEEGVAACPAHDEQTETHNLASLGDELLAHRSIDLAHLDRRVGQHGRGDVAGARVVVNELPEGPQQLLAGQGDRPVGEVLSKHTAEVVSGFCNVCGLVELAVPGRVKGLPLGVVIADSPVVVNVDPDDEELVIGQVLVEDAAVDD